MKKNIIDRIYRDYISECVSMEEYIRDFWKENKVNIRENKKESHNNYVLGMFPYPSGNSHMGHALVYSITDTIARMARFKGDNVLHPLGWDSFGLPAENAAIKHNIHPRSWTEKNIREMRDDQIGKMGFSFTINNELNTSSPEYYKWTQWLFLKLYNAGLVYRSQEWVNWDPVDQTVLANEQVINGKGWRSGALIERRKMEQWYIRITDYAERLYQGLDTLSGWSDAAKSAQRYWIGRSEGADIKFRLKIPKKDLEISVYTTRPDTLFGVTALLLAPENESLDDLFSLEVKNQVISYRSESLKKSETERSTDSAKTGINTGIIASHPITGAEIPVYISDYVIMSHGTGAVMCVPAHDKRDYEFAKSVNIPIITVINNPDESDSEGFYTQLDGTLINSGDFNGQGCREAIGNIIKYLESKNQGAKVTRYKLKDWALGRQRFWGAPIPLIQDKSGKWIPLEEDQLPVMLPDENEVDFSQISNKSSIIFPENFKTYIGSDGVAYERETDTMDTFMCSSWYAWRFLDTMNSSVAWDPEEANKWMPIDTYVGGLEHANQHLIYFRFMSYFLYDQGLTPTEEPVKRFLNNGMVQMDGAKMSKSKGNVVRPDEISGKYGADALHMYVLSIGPHDRNFDWEESGLRHKQAFLARVHKFYTDTNFICEVTTDLLPSDIQDNWSHNFIKLLYQLAEKIDHEINTNANFHVVVGKTHELANELFKRRDECTGSAARIKIFNFVAQNFLKILGLTAPHLAEYLWIQVFNSNVSLYTQRWINIDKALLKSSDIDIAIQVMINGKRHGTVILPQDQNDESVAQTVINQLKTESDFPLESIVKTIVVRDRRNNNLPKMVNIRLEPQSA